VASLGFCRRYVYQVPTTEDAGESSHLIERRAAQGVDHDGPEDCQLITWVQMQLDGENCLPVASKYP